jgi:hypothetical protein
MALEMADNLEKKLVTGKDDAHPFLTAMTIISFIRSIGIAVIEEAIEADTFLPGILIRNGELVIDKNKLLYPGDMLHEAGHIAVVKAPDRVAMNGNLKEDDNSAAKEMMAIAWSYAACVHLNIDPHIVFHEQGYKNAGASLVENFEAGRFFGTPMLDWCGMTNDPGRNKNANPVFPQMIRWTRE